MARFPLKVDSRESGFPLPKAAARAWGIPGGGDGLAKLGRAGMRLGVACAWLAWMTYFFPPARAAGRGAGEFEPRTGEVSRRGPKSGGFRGREYGDLAEPPFFPLARAAGRSARKVEPRTGEVSRRVLGVASFRDLDNGYLTSSDLHTFMEKPLNHLGYMLDYADSDQPLPDFRPYRAIIVWLSLTEMEQAEHFLPWLRDAMDYGVKLILPEGLTAPNRPGELPLGEDVLKDILARFGLEPASYSLRVDLDELRINTLRPEYFSYETELVREDSVYTPYRIGKKAGKDVEVWRRIERADHPDRYAVANLLSDAGFWSMSEKFLYFSVNLSGDKFRVAWNLNPWLMLGRVLEDGDQPAPDVTTFSGTRGAYAHVDADGPFNMTHGDVPGPSRYAIDVILNKIWKKYDFPVTVALIAAEFDPGLDLRFTADEPLEESWARPRPDYLPPHREVALKLREYAREIFALPHVQAGCHAYTHPLDWTNLYSGYAIPGYRPSYEMETRGAIEYLNRNVLPPDKPVELYQWPGDCDPPPEPLAILAEMGMANINGGDPMYDDRYNSIYYVCPLSVPKAEYRQIYTSGSNENIYTREWLGFKGAFNHVIDTFENSDRPLRLLPVNIYYHVFPAENYAGFKAIDNAYKWAAKQELCWITALEYVQAVKDFMGVRLGRTGDGGWWAENYHSCRTLRFDGEARSVDLDASLNVAGFSRHNGSLYVSLLPGDRAEVRLSERESDRPALARASGLIRKVERGERFWQAECRNWSKGFIELWAPEGRGRATVKIPGGGESAVAGERLDDGRVRFELPAGAGKWLEIRFKLETNGQKTGSPP
ncbi:MAG: hypothetical protein LBU64_10825 [Planctomycetota bacterium]|nr:hypothetical protein [Planctomycetota bacterium]